MKKSILYICICLLLSPQLNAQENLFRIFINDVNTSIGEDNEGEEENNESFTDWVSFFANKCDYTSTDIEDLNNKLNQVENVTCNNVYSNPADDSELIQGLNISLSINLKENSSEIFDYFKFVNSLNINNSKSLNGFNKLQASNNVLLDNNISENINIFSTLSYAGQFNITNNKINTFNLFSPNLTRINNLFFSGNISTTTNIFNGLSSADSVTITNNKTDELNFANNGNLIYLGNLVFSGNMSKNTNLFNGLSSADSITISNNKTEELNFANNGNLSYIRDFIFSENISTTTNLFNGLSSANSITITNNKAEELTFADNGNLTNLGSFIFQNNDIKSITGIPNAFVENAIISDNPTLERIHMFNNASNMRGFKLKNNPLLNYISQNTTNDPLNYNSNLIFDNIGFVNLNLDTIYPNIKSSPNIQIINNNKLTTIEGMMNGYSSNHKINFFGDITIENNPLLKDISGFYGQLQSADIKIINNELLENINGLKIQTATGSILIENNPSLTVLDSPLTEVNSGLSLIIKNNNNLKIFQNWSNFMYVSNIAFYLDSENLEEFNIGGGEECIIDPNHPINISPNVSSSRGFNIKANQKLHTVNLFTNCRVMHTYITIKDTNISNLNFGNKHKYYKAIKIENNDNIKDLNIFTAQNTNYYYDSNMEKINYYYIKKMDSFILKDNDELLSLNGFKNASNDYFEISNNRKLTTLNIFDNVIEYNQSAEFNDIIIENNQNLSSISNMTIDNVVNMSLKNNNLSNTTMLTNVYGIKNLDLTGNNNLNNLSGLNQTRISRSLKINQKNYGQKINNAEICGCLYNAGNIFKEDGTFYSNINEYCIIPESLDNTSCAVIR